MKLSKMSVKRCATSTAWALVDDKVLLVKHKWLKIWLAPGGHIELNELPHQAAEREFKEETGLTGEVVSFASMMKGTSSQYLPLPFAINLHTINKPRAGSFCEQHYAFSYFIKPENVLGLSDADEGITAIGWFGKEEIAGLETTDDIKREAAFVFEHFPRA
jgi:8-oxo-dGTP pyrophosphatase MutT (NUDIX family)